MTDPAPNPPPPLDHHTLLVSHLSVTDELCPMCRYNLRGLTSNRCPECNEPLILRIGLEEPKMRGYIAGLVGLALGAGFSTLLMVFVLIVVVFRNDRDPDLMEVLLGSLIPAAVEWGCMYAWFRKSRAIRSAPKRVRSSLVLACYALSLLNVVIFSTVVVH